MCLYTRFGDFVLTREAKLSPGAIILVFRDKATVQVYSSSSTTGQSKLRVLQISILKARPVMK